MISFSNPSILWALWAMAIPLIIHLINLHRHKVIYFSQTSFLKKVEKESRRTRKVNNILLLIFRMLAIGLLVFAFAKPSFDSDKEHINKATSSVVIFIDNSLSMQAENRNGNLLEQARQYAIKRIVTMSETTRVMVLSHTGLVADKISPKLVNETVKNIDYSATTISPQSLLQLFSAMENRDNSQFWIISDMQENYWRTFFELADTTLNIIPVQIDPYEPQNISIDTVWFDTPFRNVNLEQNLNVRVTNRGSETRTNIPLRLLLNDTLTAVQSFDIQKGESTTLTFSYTTNRSSWIEGCVEIHDYPIVFDNSYYFTYFLQNERKVLLIGDEDYFKPLEKLYIVSQHIHSEVSQHQFVTPAMVDSASCIFVRNPEKLSSGFAEHLYNSVTEGKSLVLLVDTVNNIEAEKQFLQRFDIQQPATVSNIKAIVNNINLNHYIFNKAILSIDKDTKMPNIERIRKFRPPFALSNTIMSTDLDDPVVISKNIGKGVVYVINVDIIGNQQFSQHPIFVPLFINMAQFIAGSLEPVYTIESNLCFDIPVDEWDNNKVPLFVSTKQQFEFIPRFQISNLNLKLCLNNQAHISGIWDLKTDSETKAKVALNYSRTESIPNYLVQDENLKSMQNFSKTDIPFDSNQTDSWFQLWQLFALLALCCFLAEIVLLTRNKRVVSNK